MNTEPRSTPWGRLRMAHGTRASATVVLFFLPPALLLFTLFVALPMGEAAWYSFFNWSGYGPPTQWVGWRNFQLLFQTPAFRTALGNNLLIIVASLVVQLPLALAMAVLLSDKVRGTTTFRLIFFLPYILAEVAAGLIWRFVYDGDYGFLAKIWGLFGATPPYVLAEPELAMYAILVVVIWKYFGFHMILYIAGLQQIDRNLNEAARMDGATDWQIFWRITLPLLAPTIRLSVFFAILGSIQLFDVIMPLTKGGPSDSTQTMVTFLYTYGVTRMQIGFGSALGVVLFCICVVFAFGYKKTLMRND
ncbi:sugar ABC transporter permease [Variovorax sp. dw_954]|uniref:carbohydrate ABC transporter permease n=1 Tax=Variovorax sp. dw_954 TaxID=2720078 RepID=UPI001BD44D06|nr:sugar ABC transporter permease [Variovorax sp. dw_954]